MQPIPSRSRPLPPPGAALVVLAILGVAWYLAEILGGFNGDVIAYQRYVDRAIVLHLLPFEYPPAALLPMALTLLPRLDWPVPVFAAWMVLPAFAGWYLTFRVKGRRAAFAYIALLGAGAAATILTRLDILPALLVLGALWAAQAERWRWAYVLLALAALLKLYPLPLFPLFALAQWRTGRSPRALAAAFLPAGLLLAAGVTVPWLLFGRASIAFLVDFAIQRPVEMESTPAVLAWALAGGRAAVEFGDIGFVSPALKETTAASTALAALLYAVTLVNLQRGRLGLGRAVIGTLAAVVSLNKVFSPQYLIWILPLVASEEGLAPAWIAVAGLTTLAYPILWEHALALRPPLMLTLVARNLLLLAIAAERVGAGELIEPARRLWSRRPVRRLTAFALGVFAVNLMGGYVVGLVQTALGDLHAPDFVAYYTAARIVVAGQGAQLYDLAVQSAFQHSITGSWGGVRLLLAFANPPQDALLVAPLGLLDYRTAYAAWVTLDALAIVAAVVILVRAERLRGWSAVLVGAVALAALPVYLVLVQGQSDGFVLLGLALLRRDWERSSWRLLPAALLLLLKPHVLLVVLLLLLLRRGTAPWLLGAGVASVSAAALAFGAATWPAWLRLVLPTASGQTEGWVTGHENAFALGGQLEALGLPGGLVTPLVLAATLAVTASLLWRGPRPPFDLAVAVVASVLLSLHLNAHDLVLLLLPGVVVGAAVLRRPAPRLALALAAAAVTMDLLLTVRPGLVFAGVLALGWAGWRAGGRDQKPIDEIEGDVRRDRLPAGGGGPDERPVPALSKTGPRPPAARWPPPAAGSDS
jgi:hypothetical protein